MSIAEDAYLKARCNGSLGCGLNAAFALNTASNNVRDTLFLDLCS